MAVKPKPGRPVTNHRVQEIMKERKCSRTWAYELWRRERERIKSSVSGPMFFHCDDV